jgi:hypothetical protein
MQRVLLAPQQRKAFGAPEAEAVELLARHRVRGLIAGCAEMHLDPLLIIAERAQQLSALVGQERALGERPSPP